MLEGRELERKLISLSNEILNKMDADRPPKAPWNHSENNWASEIHHPCKRFLTYCRLDWENRQPMSIDGRYRVEEGKKQEITMKHMLEDVGFEVNLAQVSYKWGEYKISGKTDGSVTLRLPGDREQICPIEITTVQPWYWESTRTIEEIKNHPKFWINRKPSQLNTYFFMQNLPGGFLIIKTFGKRPRVLPMLIDYDLGERDIQTCEEVNLYVEERQYPDRIEFDSVVCGMCGFSHLCEPIRTSNISGMPPELIPHIQRYCDLQPHVDEFNHLQKYLIGSGKEPGLLRGKNIFHGDITIGSSSFVTRHVKGLPPKTKARYTVASKGVRTSIVRRAGFFEEADD